MQSINALMQPGEWLAAWRPDRRRVILRASSPTRVNEVVAVRIELAGLGVRATLVGTVRGASREGARWAVELALDPDSQAAVRFLSATAQGEPVTFRQRSPRYLTRLPVVVDWGAGEYFTFASCISIGGCAVRWPGPLPDVGQGIGLRVGTGPRATRLRGAVCWKSAAGSGGAVGIRILSAAPGAGAWGGLFAQVARSGAPVI
ncbi:MAG TPA: PilZ domain-containing protein [Anaeromyxobacteraceae bacterium]|jgi:hypothetical protein